MCGIAGFLGGPPGGDSSFADAASRMGNAIRHRGPDDGDVWLDEAAGIALAHRRLSILDLSPAGRQPMISPAARFVLVFNGEIYNHLDLRHNLQKNRTNAAWRGHADTETLLAGFEQWGIRKTLEQAVGMFAMAIWDRQQRMLTLARDRFGEKPLYFGRQGNTFLFGSELKAVRACPGFSAEVDRGALALLLRHGNVPAPHSIYSGIGKIMPGTMLTVAADGREYFETYFSAPGMVDGALARRFSGTDREVLDGLEAVLRQAVRGQMVADVPLGAFLSGGVDSSAVVALMQAESVRPVKTFSIGFNEAEYNEADHAKAVAAHLHTDHCELYVTAEDARQVIPSLPGIYDEPFADSSQIPTFLVSRLARQEVKVALSGDAGDEIFCGYNRYMLAARWWPRLQRLPAAPRSWAGRCISGISPAVWDRASHPLRAMLPRRARHASIGDKLHKGARVLSSRSVEELYRRLVSQWDEPARVVLGSREPESFLFDQAGNGSFPQVSNAVGQMMAHDLLGYLPNDILVKVDRAAMAVSLETRIPFLDHRVAEYAWRLPDRFRIRDGQSKWALRQILYRHVPKALIERPKAGFAVPVGAWLRGPLREWAEHLLAETRLRSEGYFDPHAIRRVWADHLSGRRNAQAALWPVLIFQQWHEHQAAAVGSGS